MPGQVTSTAGLAGTVVDDDGDAIVELAGEGEEGEDLQARLNRAFDCLAHRLHAVAVPERPRQVSLACPPPVAIHDDGDVAGDGAVQSNSREELIGGHSLLTPP